MKITIGADHAALEFKETVKAWLLSQDHSVEDVGTFSKDSCDFPDFAQKVAENITSGKSERGILICTTGSGMALSANKKKGIRAVNVYCPCEASLAIAAQAREHLDSNVLCLSAKFMSPDFEFTKKIVNAWLSTKFKGNEPGCEKYARRLSKTEL